MTTLSMQSGSGLRGPLRGWTISLAAHALVLAWLVHAVPAPRYLHDGPDAAPERRSDLILVPLRALPAPAPASVAKPAPKPKPAPGPAARPAATAKPAPATAPSRPRRAAPQAVISLPAATATASSAAAPGPAPEAAPAPAAAAPGFDMQAARGAVRAALKDRIGEPATPGRTAALQATRDEKLGTAIDRGRTLDCQAKYAGGTSLNVILLIPLAIDTLKEGGCKWK